jgi:4-amino-4-deoxy-L-arabinose transferase-like glycosyltransferase
MLTGNSILKIFDRYGLASILLLALVIRLLAAGYWHNQASASSDHFRLGDSHSYWILARQISQGLPYQYGSPDASLFRVPLYPMLLSGVAWIEDQSTAVWMARCIGCLMGTAVVGLIAVLSERLMGRRAGRCAALLASLYPSAIGSSLIVLSEALLMPLMLLQMNCMIRLIQHDPADRPRWKLALMTGAVAGLAVLTRPSWLLLVPMSAAVAIALATSHARRHQWIHGLLIGVGLCIVMSPWWIRNYQVTGKFVLTTLQVGPSLYDGLHPGASGASDQGMRFMRELEQQQRSLDMQTYQRGMTPESTFEWRLNRLAAQQALQWAADNPHQTLSLAWQKFRKIWSPWPAGGQVGSTAVRLAITISSVLVMLASLLGTIAVWRSGSRSRLPMLALLWLPCLYFTLLHMVFVASIRYREPAVLLLTTLAGCGIATLLNLGPMPLREPPFVGQSPENRQHNSV